MRKVFLIILCIVMTLVMSSCAKQFELTSTDEKYVFNYKDIKDLDLSGYRVKKLSNGRAYFYSKTENILHGFYSLYGISYSQETGEEINLRTNFSIQKSKSGAIKLLEGHIKILTLFDKQNVSKLKAPDYNVDQIYLYSIDDQIIITLQKGNLFYQVDIQGIQLNEAQLKANLIKKIDYLSRNGLGKYQVK